MENTIYPCILDICVIVQMAKEMFLFFFFCELFYETLKRSQLPLLYNYNVLICQQSVQLLLITKKWLKVGKNFINKMVVVLF